VVVPVVVTVIGSMKSPSVPNVLDMNCAPPAVFTVTRTLGMVTPVKLKLRRWFDVAGNVHFAFWPGTEVVNVFATPADMVPG
jgi:hypothetical protein